MHTDIVIRSWYRDFSWLASCLQGIHKFAHGFRDVVIVVPEGSRPYLERSVLKAWPVAVCPQVRDDYLGQQVTKLYADTYTDADYIVHLDSDCVLRRPCQPSDLLLNGRPEILLTPCSQFARRAPWQRVTERFLQRPVHFDYMRRQPLVYPRWLYESLRAEATHLHGRELRDYILAQPPMAFSEFNALGAFAHAAHPQAFAWTETASVAFDERFCRIFWSWGDDKVAAQAEITAILEGPDQ